MALKRKTDYSLPMFLDLQIIENEKWKTIQHFSIKMEQRDVKKKILFFEYTSIEEKFLETKERFLERCIAKATKVWKNKNIQTRLYEWTCTGFGDSYWVVWQNGKLYA